MTWKKERGALGILSPLLGNWSANEGSTDEQNPECIRHFEYVLDRKYIQLEVLWKRGMKDYLDHTLIGLNGNKKICFWSFTSDGK